MKSNFYQTADTALSQSWIEEEHLTVPQTFDFQLNKRNPEKIYHPSDSKIPKDQKTKECTFQPEIHTLPQELYSPASREKIEKHASTPFFKRVMDWAKQRDEELIKKQEEFKKEELVNCSFTPNADRSPTNYSKKRPASAGQAMLRKQNQKQPADDKSINATAEDIPFKIDSEDYKQFASQILSSSKPGNWSIHEKLFSEQKVKQKREEDLKKEEEETFKKRFTFKPKILNKSMVVDDIQQVKSRYKLDHATSSGNVGDKDKKKQEILKTMEEKQNKDLTFKPKINESYFEQNKRKKLGDNKSKEDISDDHDNSDIIDNHENEERNNKSQNEPQDTKVMDAYLQSDPFERLLLNKSLYSAKRRQKLLDEEQENDPVAMAERNQKTTDMKQFFMRQEEFKAKKQRKLEEMREKSTPRYKPEICAKSEKMVSQFNKIASVKLVKQNGETNNIPENPTQPEEGPNSFSASNTGRKSLLPQEFQNFLNRLDVNVKSSEYMKLELKKDMEQKIDKELTFKPKINKKSLFDKLMKPKTPNFNENESEQTEQNVQRSQQGPSKELSPQNSQRSQHSQSQPNSQPLSPTNKDKIKKVRDEDFWKRMSEQPIVQMEEKKKEIQQTIQSQEMKECSFKPKITKKGGQSISFLKVKEDPDAYMNKVMLMQKEEEQWRQQERTEKARKELQECTFHPKTTDTPEYVRLIVQTLALAKPKQNASDKPDWR